eukprot:TRINITY_DN30701_c0_g1_i2.p7 TRINITY_DN30701_c0_g1~~TRINITY_DN30701_c0_g1_i2.p7  ORF type:complete len:105 (-),score=8.84 TRINITY_DN30701_c0_g1_i2:437-751(-)
MWRRTGAGSSTHVKGSMGAWAHRRAHAGVGAGPRGFYTHQERADPGTADSDTRSASGDLDKEAPCAQTSSGTRPKAARPPTKVAIRPSRTHAVRHVMKQRRHWK